MEIPSSLNAALAARKAEVADDSPKDPFRTMKVRVQLLLAYGMLALLTFGILVAINAVLSSTIQRTVVDTSRAETLQSGLLPWCTGTMKPDRTIGY